MEAPTKTKRRRWILGLTITALSLGLVIFVGLYVALRPPISQEAADTVLRDLEHRARPADSVRDAEVASAILAVRKESEALQIRFGVAVGVPLEELIGDRAPAPDAAAWARLEATAAPFLAALDTLPDDDRLPPMVNLGAVSPGLGNTSFVRDLCRALTRAAEHRGDHAALVPLACRFTKLFVVRGSDTHMDHMIASNLVRAALPSLLTGIPHAAEADLDAALAHLRRASWSTTEAERATAAETLRGLRALTAALQDPDGYVEQHRLILSGGWYVRSTAYLRYQRAHFAHRSRSVIDPGIPAGWLDRADHSEAKLLSLSDPGFAAWRNGLSTFYWFHVIGVLPGFYRTLSVTQTEVVAARVAVASELHRRQHGRYPGSIAELDPWLDLQRSGLPNADPVRIVSEADRCVIAIDSRISPVEFVLQRSSD